MTAPANDAPKWDVVIEFKDGAYSSPVYASTEESAYQLALQDARMCSTNPTYAGPVVAKFITKAK